MFLLRVVAPLASLFFFSAFAVAQVSAANCTLETWDWTFNSLGQTPCTVAAYMMATCHGGHYRLPPLSTGGTYLGNRSNNLCHCNTVSYSLLSACSACKGEGWLSWFDYVTNCNNTMPPSSFPNPVPLGIRVPQWALLDVTRYFGIPMNRMPSVTLQSSGLARFSAPQE
ncbi:hypothetical protein DFH94DRAFT_344985 [Russula ochroleuca]|uniref:Uncharacterized protein n=1 Tax=Russula ochroleuca TaxID=152965 RepID=A0A9P5MN78_9AGAM|nr:hypothetical protein DFH94DRAFT_344985 [Russula ochroleuca]